MPKCLPGGWGSLANLLGLDGGARLKEPFVTSHAPTLSLDGDVNLESRQARRCSYLGSLNPIMRLTGGASDMNTGGMLI